VCLPALVGGIDKARILLEGHWADVIDFIGKSMAFLILLNNPLMRGYIRLSELSASSTR
jgi:hypothetical protein